MGKKALFFEILGALIGVVSVVILVLLSLQFLFPWEKYTVPIMMYHHVANQEFEGRDVTPENFRYQMNYLKKNHYNVIPLSELVAGDQAGKSFPRNTVAITFDDGYVDNYESAIPILKEFQLPATFFVSPPGAPVEAIKEPGVTFMNWEQLKELRDAHFDFGSQGMSQAYLPDLSDEKKEYEIFESKRILEKELGVKIDSFVYPCGGFTDEIKDMLEEAGYKAGFTTNRGYDRFDKDVYEINRIKFSNHDTNDVVMWAKLSGYYNRFRDLKQPH